jgi:predicted nucleic acid-binding Zn ribbon protein
MQPDHSATMESVVENVVKGMGLGQRFWEQALITEWESLVGPQVAKHARPGRLERKVLHIFVDHPAWLSDLSRYGQKQVLANLQERFGPDKIKSIHLQLDPEKR